MSRVIRLLRGRGSRPEGSEPVSTAKTRYFVAWMLLAIVAVLVTGSVNLLNYWHIANRGSSTEGVVVQVTREMHDTVRYQYSVSGRTYSGQAHPFPPNKPIGQLVEGSPLTVYYDSLHPERSVLGWPASLLKDELIWVAITGVLLPALILLAWRYILFPAYRRAWIELRRG